MGRAALGIVQYPWFFGPCEKNIGLSSAFDWLMNIGQSFLLNAKVFWPLFCSTLYYSHTNRHIIMEWPIKEKTTAKIAETGKRVPLNCIVSGFWLVQCGTVYHYIPNTKASSLHIHPHRLFLVIYHTKKKRSAITPELMAGSSPNFIMGTSNMDAWNDIRFLIWPIFWWSQRSKFIWTFYHCVDMYLGTVYIYAKCQLNRTLIIAARWSSWKHTFVESIFIISVPELITIVN
jgi:hypothetical protein